MEDSVIDYSQAALEDYRKATKNPESGVQLKVKDTYEGEDPRPEEARHPPDASLASSKRMHTDRLGPIGELDQVVGRIGHSAGAGRWPSADR